MDPAPQSARVLRLKKRFLDVLSGSVKLDSRGASLFLEGLCAQDDPVVCLDAIAESAHGLSSVQSAMRFDLSLQFMNGLASAVLGYLLRASDVGGDALDNLLFHVVEPPVFWGVFVRTFEQGALNEDAELVFARVLSRLLILQDHDTSSYRDVASRPSVQSSLISSPKHDIREVGHLIKHILSTTTGSTTAYDVINGPGGRHDNDFADYRDIAILPTADEILSQKPSFLHPTFHDELNTSETPVRDYLDNSFRLLREDMVYDVRQELQTALQKDGKLRGLRVESVSIVGIYTGGKTAGKDNKDRKCRWGVKLKCDSDLWQLKSMKDQDARVKFLTKDPRGSKLLRHQSLACLASGQDIISFGVVNRVEELLACKPPVIVLQLDGNVNVRKTLSILHTNKNIRFIHINTATFAFEPVLLALQKRSSVFLLKEILLWNPESPLASPKSAKALSRIADALISNPSTELNSLLNLPKPIRLDKAQAKSLVSGLQQRVSLIQGPPGTGKSFIGAILAKAIHDKTSRTILVVCYTNHQLDQFLCDLLKYNIPANSIVRLGGRPNQSTDHLSLHKQPRGKFWYDWDEINTFKEAAMDHEVELRIGFDSLLDVDDSNLMDYLETEHHEFFEAFYVPPETEDGMTRVGRNGQAIESNYLFEQWTRGQNAGVLSGEPHIRASARIWGMARSARQELLERWRRELANRGLDSICRCGEDYNTLQDSVKQAFARSTVSTLRQKRIIACTTTGAAIYADVLEQVGPEILLVEEAGEILESHILTALSNRVDQMILIGDHKQLRPKVNNYQLTVEKGEGFDLNRSLFERLVLKGFPHDTLSTQHRMRPEISAFVRELTYPELADASSTHNRPDIRGIQSNIVFVDHTHLEDDDSLIGDRSDGGSKASKRNTYEVQMVLKIVRYLAQQGYKSEDMVVLTPYLGQLYHLRDALANDSDPILNDLDSSDLARAGLSSLTQTDQKAKKGKIHLATIDNYQGEESNIVVASLTRSNKSGVIGFMDSPERLNVLLSRARDGMILIGNSNTFLHSKKGGALWKRFFTLLEDGGHVYQGFPVKCERHPEHVVLLCSVSDFDDHSPDGGCTQPCGFTLACGHTCPMKCHPNRGSGLSGPHETSQCKHGMNAKCSAGKHVITWECRLGQPTACAACVREAKRLEEIVRQQLEALKRREEAEAEHRRRVAELEAQRVAEEQRIVQEEREAREREEQQKQEEEARERREEEEKERMQARLDAIRRMSVFRPSWVEEREADRKQEERERVAAERRERLIAERQREDARAAAVARAKEYEAERKRREENICITQEALRRIEESQEAERQRKEQERAEAQRREKLIAERQREDARAAAVVRAKEYEAERKRQDAIRRMKQTWAAQREAERQREEQELAAAMSRARLTSERQREDARAAAVSRAKEYERKNTAAKEPEPSRCTIQ